MASIFTKIIKGEIPCFKIFEDDHTFSFLTLDQITPGHSLVIPKIEVDYFLDVPEPYYSAVFINSKKIARAIQRATGCPRVGTIIAGWEVPHFHYHLIPTWGLADLDFKKAQVRSKEDNLAMQKKILDNLSN